MFGMASEDLDEEEGFEKGRRREWGGEEIDEGERFGLFFFFWFGVSDVDKQKKQKSKL